MGVRKSKYNGHTLRHEFKYIISYEDYRALAAQMGHIMKHDRFSLDGGYFIRSLYFDDIYSSAYYERAAGISRRRKHRVRFYNLDPGVIKYEIKDKFDQYISKISARITPEQLDMMINCDYGFMLNSSSATLHTGYIDAKTKLLKPAVVVDYFREAFVCDEGNVRITFDTRVRGGGAPFNVFSKDMLTVPAMAEDRLILEVKYDDFCPDHVRRLLRPLNAWRTSQSKFAMCTDAVRKGLGVCNVGFD